MGFLEFLELLEFFEFLEFPEFLNIVRCFIDVSLGGRSGYKRVVIVSVAASAGPSVKHACLQVSGRVSTLDAVYARNNQFIDPNTWFDEAEMRKQVEQAAGCFILTAQEAPETNKHMRGF